MSTSTPVDLNLDKGLQQSVQADIKEKLLKCYPDLVQDDSEEVLPVHVTHYSSF